MGTNRFRWNTINSILSIGTYINASIIVLPSILLTRLSSTLFRAFQFPYILIGRCKHVVFIWLAGINFPWWIKCYRIFIPVAVLICITSIFGMGPSFNLKAFEARQLGKIWWYMGSIIICQCKNNPRHILSISSWSEVHWTINVGRYTSCGFQFCRWNCMGLHSWWNLYTKVRVV